MLSKPYPHPEERPKGASRRTQGRYAALRLNSCPASQRIPPRPLPRRSPGSVPSAVSRVSISESLASLRVCREYAWAWRKAECASLFRPTLVYPTLGIIHGLSDLSGRTAPDRRPCTDLGRDRCSV